MDINQQNQLANKLKESLDLNFKCVDLIQNDEYGIGYLIGSNTDNEAIIDKDYIIFKYRFMMDIPPYRKFSEANGPKPYWLYFKENVSDYEMIEYFNKPSLWRENDTLLCFQTFWGLKKYIKKHYPSFIKNI